MRGIGKQPQGRTRRAHHPEWAGIGCDDPGIEPALQEWPVPRRERGKVDGGDDHGARGGRRRTRPGDWLGKPFRLHVRYEKVARWAGTAT